MTKCIAFQADISHIALPAALNDPFANEPHELCTRAAQQLQDYLRTQHDFEHNFGLHLPNENPNLKPIGKMFGVLVVQQADGELGFLAAFSGKLANANHHHYFVPPVFDSLSEDEFLNSGMRALKVIKNQIKDIEGAGCKATHQLMLLKEKRKAHSQGLQKQLFDAYQFLNAKGEQRTPNQLFENPPAGAGECAAPKLLQYAYQHGLTPISIAEFWWGAPPSSGSTVRQHTHYYPACEDKCRGVLGWMLG